MRYFAILCGDLCLAKARCETKENASMLFGKGYTEVTKDEWDALTIGTNPSADSPTEEEDTASMLIDHEYRLTLLELGLSE